MPHPAARPQRPRTRRVVRFAAPLLLLVVVGGGTSFLVSRALNADDRGGGTATASAPQGAMPATAGATATPPSAKASLRTCMEAHKLRKANEVSPQTIVTE